MNELPPVTYNTRIYGGSARASFSGSVTYAAGELYFMSNDLAYYVGNELTAQQIIDMRTADRPIEDLDMAFLDSQCKSKKEEFYREEWNEQLKDQGSSLPEKNELNKDQGSSLPEKNELNKAQGSSLPQDESATKMAWNCYCPIGLAGLVP